MLRIYEIMFKIKSSQFFQCPQWCLIFFIMSHTFSAYYQVAVHVYLHYCVASIIFHCNVLGNFLCSYCRKMFIVKHFLLTSSSDAWCILCCTLCWVHSRGYSRVYLPIHAVTKNEIKNYISDHSIFILFF